MEDNELEIINSEDIFNSITKKIEAEKEISMKWVKNCVNIINKTLSTINNKDKKLPDGVYLNFFEDRLDDITINIDANGFKVLFDVSDDDLREFINLYPSIKGKVMLLMSESGYKHTTIKYTSNKNNPLEFEMELNFGIKSK